MTTIEYPTGRTYNGAQVLHIEVPQQGADDDALVPVKFHDPARNITGYVKLFSWTLAERHWIGHDVLYEYDSGRYTLAQGDAV